MHVRALQEQDGLVRWKAVVVVMTASLPFRFVSNYSLRANVLTFRCHSTCRAPPPLLLHRLHGHEAIRLQRLLSSRLLWKRHPERFIHVLELVRFNTSICERKQSAHSAPA